MSVYLIYFEKKQHPIDEDFSKFNEVNKYPCPESWICEDVMIVHENKKINANIFFDGISSDIFYVDKLKHGEKYRKELFDFILSRLKNKCIQVYLYFDIFDGNIPEEIVLPNYFETIGLSELEKVFQNNIFRGFFRVI